jgi:hypothetical protein
MSPRCEVRPRSSASLVRRLVSKCQHHGASTCLSVPALPNLYQIGQAHLGCHRRCGQRLQATCCAPLMQEQSSPDEQHPKNQNKHFTSVSRIGITVGFCLGFMRPFLTLRQDKKIMASLVTFKHASAPAEVTNQQKE